MMSVREDLTRLFTPASIAVIGGGKWGEGVVVGARKLGFKGEVWPIHPRKSTVGGVPTFAAIADLPAPPDAAFVAVNRRTTIKVIEELAQAGTGGAVCFASGFAETRQEDVCGPELERKLCAAAGAMPFLGPNCYGFVNALDGVVVWPDQHGMSPQKRGVAIISQSSNIAINLSMQTRGLPMAALFTLGNQACLGFADIAEALIADERITALGLYIEGIGPLTRFEAMAARAAARKLPIVALKAGRSAVARQAGLSHSASISGSAKGASALFARLGIAEVTSLPMLLDTLKLLHDIGPLAEANVASISCSGGEAALVGDAARAHGIATPPLTTVQEKRLRKVLGPNVALANPLDYHTWIWGDLAAMTECFAAMLDGPQALTLLIVDFPNRARASDTAWRPVIAAARKAALQVGRPIALVATLPENMPEDVVLEFSAPGHSVLRGLDEALVAVRSAARVCFDHALAAPLLPQRSGAGQILGERLVRMQLAAAGIAVPSGTAVSTPAAARTAAARLPPPLVLKRAGVVHKSDMGGVALNLGKPDDVFAAACAMDSRGGQGWWLEEMITGAIAELLVGIHPDEAHGMILTLAAGGVHGELFGDSQSLLLPVTREDVGTALEQLRIAPVLKGYRGQPAADFAAIIDAVMALQGMVIDNACLLEVEINPLLCLDRGVVAVDALIRQTGEE